MAAAAAQANVRMEVARCRRQAIRSAAAALAAAMTVGAAAVVRDSHAAPTASAPAVPIVDDAAISVLSCLILKDFSNPI